MLATLQVAQRMRGKSMSGKMKHLFDRFDEDTAEDEEDQENSERPTPKKKKTHVSVPSALFVCKPSSCT